MIKTVLIVDDSRYMRTILKDILTTAGYDVVGQAGNGEMAIDMALDLKPDLITLDNVLPDMLGIDILKTLKVDEKIESKVVMISAIGQESIISEAMSLG